MSSVFVDMIVLAARCIPRLHPRQGSDSQPGRYAVLSHCAHRSIIQYCLASPMWCPWHLWCDDTEGHLLRI